MKTIKKTGMLLIVTVIMITFTGTCIQAAAQYKDVPTTHWAYSSVSKMSDLGIMVGDGSGNYYPNNTVDKFSASKMLARLSGYKYVNLSTSEQSYQDKAYSLNKTLIGQYKNKFAKWDGTADMEIAFLLEKEILTVADLNQFVILTNDNLERVRNLTREDAAVFLVRLMGKNSEAQAYTYSAKFADDSSISANAKPYVYYLKGLDIVSGNSDNKYNPNDSVTKAALAVLLEKTYNHLSGNSESKSASSNSSASTSASSSGVTDVKGVSGKIDKIYASLNAVQIDDNGAKNIYKMTSGSSIYIDGYLKTISELYEGMSATGILSNGELIELRCTSTGTVTATDTKVTTPAASVQLTTVGGTISGLTNETNNRSISVDVKYINARGSIISETKAFNLSSDCSVKRGNETISFSDVETGESVTVSYSGSSVYVIEAEEKEVSLIGKLISKELVDATKAIVLTIADETGKYRQFTVNSETYISRKDVGNYLNWYDLRIGDTVEIEAVYGVLTNIYATGIKTNVDGYVEELHITNNSSTVVINNDTGKNVTYQVADTLVDIYSIKVGSKLRLRLDSDEVEGFAILEESANSTISGYVYSFKNDTFTVSAQKTQSVSPKTIYIDSKTVFYDATTGKTTTYGSIETGYEVYVTFENSSSAYAKTVTVLSK